MDLPELILYVLFAFPILIVVYSPLSLFLYYLLLGLEFGSVRRIARETGRTKGVVGVLIGQAMLPMPMLAFYRVLRSEDYSGFGLNPNAFYATWLLIALSLIGFPIFGIVRWTALRKGSRRRSAGATDGCSDQGAENVDSAGASVSDEAVGLLVLVVSFVFGLAASAAVRLASDWAVPCCFVVVAALTVWRGILAYRRRQFNSFWKIYSVVAALQPAWLSIGQAVFMRFWE
jgi:hypothetical protein